jgi:hypothetical protein
MTASRDANEGDRIGPHTGEHGKSSGIGSKRVAVSSARKKTEGLDPCQLVRQVKKFAG